MNSKCKLFVYGTLRSGFSNNHFLSTSKKLYDAFTCDEYALFADGIPFLSDKLQISKITGEVWEISKLTLKKIDMLEGYDEKYPYSSWYQRKQIYVYDATNTTVEQVDCYFINSNEIENNHKLTLLDSGDYTEYYNKIINKI